jgi:hypothetical protein
VRHLGLLLCLLLLAGCGAGRPNDPDTPGPGLIFPAHFAEGDNEEERARQQAKPAPRVEERKPKGSQPDPEPLRQQKQYEYELVYQGGKVSVASVRPMSYAQPVVTARRMGRFAIELWIGQELVERVRFDFPLTSADEPPGKERRRLGAMPNLGDGATVTRTVLVPAAERARRAVLVDRATGSETDLPWPPDRPPSASLPEGERPQTRPAASLPEGERPQTRPAPSPSAEKSDPPDVRP